MTRCDGCARDCPVCGVDAAYVAEFPWAVVDALERVLAYLWADELKDFETQTSDLAHEHIFPALCRVRWWLSGLRLEHGMSQEGNEQE